MSIKVRVVWPKYDEDQESINSFLEIAKSSRVKVFFVGGEHTEHADFAVVGQDAQIKKFVDKLKDYFIDEDLDAEIEAEGLENEDEFILSDLSNLNKLAYNKTINIEGMKKKIYSSDEFNEPSEAFTHAKEVITKYRGVVQFKYDEYGEGQYLTAYIDPAKFDKYLVDLDESAICTGKRLNEDTEDGYVVLIAYKGPQGKFDYYSYADNECDNEYDECAIGYDEVEGFINPMTKEVALNTAREIMSNINCEDVLVGVISWAEATKE